MSNDIVPIFDPDRPFRVWAINEVYKEGGLGSYVPNVNDAVWDWEEGLYRVISVDMETGYSQLERYQSVTENDNVTPDDILLGAVPGRASEAYRLYINDKFDPISAAIDSRLLVYGSGNKYVRLFKGFEIGQNGEVVSAYYDKNNELKDDKIPLEMAGTIDITNKCIKTPVVGYVSKGMEDGEVVTCVVYGTNGSVTSINPLLVKNVSFVRSATASNKYVTHLTINSPFLSGDSKRLEVPLHTPLEELKIDVMIHYSNGEKKLVTSDDPHITISGLEVYKVSQKNQTTPLIVTYKFPENESNYCATSDDGRTLSVVYQLTTMPPSTVGIIKLYAIPRWSVGADGWLLDYYMYNKDGNLHENVTDLVEVRNTEGNPYSPSLFNVEQNLILTLDVTEISDLNVEYIHNQNFNITLNSKLGNFIPSWSINYIEDGIIDYGKEQLASITDLDGIANIDLSQGITSLNGWLDRMFMSVYPQISDEDNETLQPTHFIISYKEESTLVEIESYNDYIPFPISPLSGDTMVIEWIYRTEAKDFYLALSPVTVTY